jgi:hypothetical protein
MKRLIKMIDDYVISACIYLGIATIIYALIEPILSFLKG